jgi:hypothetical protein
MNSSLQNMQRDFLNSLRKQDSLKIEVALMEKPVSKPGLRAYIHAYSSRLTEALDNDHPCLGAYLGDSLWQEMCTGYIAQYPSQYRSLRNFGDLLPEYLLHAEAFKKNPEIAELAKIERQLLDCFDAPDAASIEFTELLSISEQAWPNLTLKFHPSLKLLTNKYNTFAVWQAMKDQQAPPALVTLDNYWIIWRDSDRVTNFRSIDFEEYRSLLYFLRGDNFSQLCQSLLEAHSIEEVPVLALGYIKAWFAEGWVVGIAQSP